MTKAERTVTTLLLFVVLVVIPVTCNLLPGRKGRSEYKVTLDRITASAERSKAFRNQTGRWPTNFGELVSWGIDPAITNDGWGRPLIYSAFDYSVGRGSVMSFGSDGSPKGQGDAADMQAMFW